jgi:hypothetical protein
VLLSAFPSSSGSRTTLTAMRRASSFVSTFACLASVSRLPTGVADDVAAGKRRGWVDSSMAVLARERPRTPSGPATLRSAPCGANQGADLAPLRRGFFHVRSSSSRMVRVTVFWQPLHLKILVSTGAFAGTRGNTLIRRSGAAQCGHMGAIKVGDISDNVVRSDSPITALSGRRRGFFASSR